MRRNLLAYLLLFLLLVGTAKSEIRLNEIAPAADPEWVELYNPNPTEVNLQDWFLDDIEGKGSSPKKFSLIIPANGFGIVETSSVFNNTGGDSVRLLNPEEQEIDHFNYINTLTAQQSWSRCPNGGDSWLLSILPSKNASNFETCLLFTPTTILPSLTLSITPELTEPSLTIEPTPTPVPINNIYLSEIMIYPDNESEWVELYNDNDFSVNLTNWFVDDSLNSGSTPKIFSIEIKAKSYATVTLSSNIFNNDQDTIRLLKNDQTEVESIDYQSPPKGQTYSRSNFLSDSTWCFTSPSKNQANSSCSVTASTGQTISQITNIPSVLAVKSNPGTKSTNYPIIKNLRLGTFFHPLNLPKKVLGLQTSKPNPQIKQFNFYLKFTKMSLWLNLGLNLLSLTFLSLYLRRLSL